MHRDSENVETAREYLRGKSFAFPELNQLWENLKAELEFGYARNVLALLREGVQLSGEEKAGRKDKEKMTQQHALCTSKDPDLSAAERHDAALRILEDLSLDDPEP